MRSRYENKNCCQSVSEGFQKKVIGGLERLFQRYGEFVARFPYAFVIGSVILCLACGAGWLTKEEETDGLKLWLPTKSEFREESEWLSENFPSKERTNTLLIYSETDNILKAEHLKSIYELRMQIANITTENGSTWDNSCIKIPLGDSSSGGTSGSSLAFPDEVCADWEKKKADEENLPQACKESHIFEIWANDGKFDAISNASVDALTDASVMTTINDPDLKSGLTGSSLGLNFLGSVKLNKDSNKIEHAKAMLLSFSTKHIDPLDEDVEDEEQKEKLEEELERIMEFEEAFIELVLDYKYLSGDLKAIPNAERSAEDVNGDAISGDLFLLLVGYVVVIVYVMVMLGKFNSVEQRAFLSLAGIMSVVMGIISSYGFCSLIGFVFTPMHQLLPFMFLGIGIDDMFVIVQSFDTIPDSIKDKSLKERFGICMKHAGVAISITSVTDLMAFGIGASTVLPALQSFCVYAAFGIFFVFLYMITFFFGWFYYDQMRAENHRDAILCCWKKYNWKPNACSQTSLMAQAFKFYAKILLMTPVKILALFISFSLLGVSTWGVTRLEANFEEKWFVKDGTYLRNYLEAKDDYFSSSGGMKGNVYIAEAPEFHNSMDKVKDLREMMTKNLSDTLEAGGSKGSFDESFLKFVRKTEATYPQTALAKEDFYSKLAEFLYTGGAGYQPTLLFHGDLKCAAITPDLKLLSVRYEHSRYDGANQHIEEIRRLKEFVEGFKDDFGEGAKVFAYSGSYVNYKIMEIITEELIRNIFLALLCVFLATLFLIADIFASLLVVVSVLMAIVNVGGFMYFWGLAVDTTAAILMTIAMGLSVDYSAHIAHSFMVTKGSRNERIYNTLVNLGPAVLNGGFSTFLAFGMLMTSESYVFITFFKIFLLIVVFGLFHGLIFLPVVLSVIGPGTSGTHADDHNVQPLELSRKITPVWGRRKMVDVME